MNEDFLRVSCINILLQIKDKQDEQTKEIIAEIISWLRLLKYRENKKSILLEKAIEAIGDLKDDNIKKWFLELFDILALQKYATITTKDGFLVDIEKFGYTDEFASFFDIYAHKNKINFQIKPIESETLNEEHSYWKWKRN